MHKQSKGGALRHLQEEYASVVAQLDTQRRDHASAIMKLQEEHEAERAQVLASNRRQLETMKQQAAALLFLCAVLAEGVSRPEALSCLRPTG